MKRRERRAAANKAGTSLASRGTPGSLHDAGRQRLQAGQLTEAESCGRQALAIDASHADSLYLMSLIAIQRRHYDQAIEWVSRAIGAEPRAEFLSTLGTTLQSLRRFEEALKVFDKAISLRPDDAELWKNLGSVLVDLGRADEAVLSFQHALTINPRYVDAANLQGLQLYRLGHFQKALECFNLSIDIQARQADALHMRALVLQHLKQFDQALADNQLSYELDPNNAHTSNNLGYVLQLLGRHGESLPWFERALALYPNFVEALGNKAFALAQFHRFDEAFACYATSMAIDPHNALTQWNLALLQMLTGNFEAGWVGRESRWRTGLGMADPKFAQPLWLGDAPLEGKTILLYADEGLGDCIQFARYVPMIAACGARIVLAVSDPACPLLSGLPGVALCLPKSATLPEFHLHCPISSLPLAFKTTLDTIPSAQAYLPPPAERLVQEWEKRLGPRDRLRVGLVWAGNPGHTNDHNRSIPLDALTGLLDADATFVSLQKDLRPGDRETLLKWPEIVDLTPDLTDFVQTAALVSCLDLVITVDTSVAHLAGALGRPTWILLPYTPDYRWLLDRDDSPWYPTMRLFRQTDTREYASVIGRVRAELLAMISAGKAG